MKKILLGLSILILSACTLGKSITPKERVKDFLDKYKNQDSEVMNDLEETVSSEYSGEFKERYKTLMINQYKDLDYKITDEIIDGNNAIVSVDITVYDYSNALTNASDYLKDHEKEFYKDDNKTIDNDKFLDYKLGLLEKVTDKKTYSIDFSLTKDENDWKLDSLSDADIKKIHGIYNE